MAKLLKLRRGTTSQHNTFTGAEGEVTIDTTKDTAVVHDGSQAGGRPLAREDMSNVSSSSIASRLGADSIATTKIAGGALPTDVTVASANIVNGTIVESDIANDSVSTAKMINFPTQTILGRETAGTGNATTLTAAQVRGIINVENGATADQTASEIRTLVESASDSNVFTDADHSKLNGIASGATNVTNTNQLTNGAGFITATLTNEQVQDIVGGMVSSNTESGITVTYQDSDGTLDFSVASQTDQNFTNADHSKLNGIESGATADQTASEIVALIADPVSYTHLRAHET